MSISEKLITIAENEQRVYEKGKQAECDAFWDVLQVKGGAPEYNYGFYGGKWKDTIYNPKYGFNNIHSMAYCFSWTGITDTKKPISFSTSPINLNLLFDNANYLKTIRTLTVNENVKYTGWFNNCKKLENITFAGIIANTIAFSTSPLLTKVSILSIFSCLSDATGGTTLTLNTTAVNNAFETASGMADGSTSEEWLNLVATKPNWTISLS